MRDCVRDLCVLSVFCGAALSLCPEGVSKKILRILESAILLTIILSSLGKMDFSAYPVELARFHEKERELLDRADERETRLDRIVREEEYVSYVERKADELGAQLSEIRIRTRWNREGLWVPDSSSIRMSSEGFRRELSGILTGELGIPEERQLWISA